MRRLLLLALLVLPSPAQAQLVGRGQPEPSKPAPHGPIVGRVERLEGIPLEACRVLVVGTPVVEACGADGTFRIDRITLPGAWVLEIVPSDTVIPRRRVSVLQTETGVDVGAISMTFPGAIIGTVSRRDTSDASPLAVVLDGMLTTLTTGRAGSFTFSQAPSGTLTLQVYFPAGVRRQATASGPQTLQCHRIASATVRVAHRRTTSVTIVEPAPSAGDDRTCQAPAR